MNKYFHDILKQVDDSYSENNQKFKISDYLKEDSKGFQSKNEIELDIEDVKLDEDFTDEQIEDVQDRQQVQNLFDGYIGAKNFIPNPYEYGPNASYRNINEGIVYKKNEQNLWEAFVRDGKPGQQGPRGFAGGGTGVEEVKKITTEIVTSAITNISTYQYETDYVKLFENNKIAMIGSSTTEHNTRPYFIVSGGSGFCETDDGTLICAKNRYGLPFNIIYNGGVGGASTSAISASMSSMISAAPSADWHWIHLGANDMQNGNLTPESTFYDYALPMIKKSFSVGAKVILVVPFTTSSANQTRINYVKQYSNLCKSFSYRYPDKIYVWDLFEILSEPYNGITPAKFLSKIDGVHLSVDGAWESAKAAYGLISMMKIPPILDPLPYKQPLNLNYDLNNFNGYTAFFATSSNGPIDEYLRNSIDLIASQSGTIFLKYDIEFLSATNYRIISEVEILTSGVRSVDILARGASTSDLYSQTGGITYDDVNSYTNEIPIGTKKILISSYFNRSTKNSPTRAYTRFFANSIGASIRIKMMAIIN